MKAIVPIIGLESMKTFREEESSILSIIQDMGLEPRRVNPGNFLSILREDPLYIRVPAVIVARQAEFDPPESHRLMGAILEKYSSAKVIEGAGSELVTKVFQVYPTLGLWQSLNLSYTIRGAILFSYAQLSLASLSIDQIAREVSVSKERLGRMFQDEIGCSLWEYVVRLRVVEARRLLCETRLPISEIAIAVGYRELAVFDRMFKKRVGITPNAYRRNAKRES